MPRDAAAPMTRPPAGPATGRWAARRLSARLIIAAGYVASTALLGGCRTSKTLSGHIVDYDTREPIAGATVTVAQSGWGVSGSGLVWDKSFVASGISDASGAFRVEYTVGSSANTVAASAGYSEFRHWYEPNRPITIPLKRLSGSQTRLPSGFLNLGVRTDGQFFGWNFAEARTVTDPSAGDIFPTSVGSGSGVLLDLRAGGRGGFHFVSQADLGVDDDFLVFADVAPEEGYTPAITLKGNGPAGVCFVRAADGTHYAKFAFTPNGLASSNGGGIRQSIDLPFVYNPSGARRLPFDRPPLTLAR